MDLAGLFYKELRKIILLYDTAEEQALRSLYQLFLAYLHEISSQEKIAFTTIFARIRYAAEKYAFSPELYQQFQFYRIAGNPANKSLLPDSFEVLVFGTHLLYHSIRKVYGSEPSEWLEEFLARNPLPAGQLTIPTEERSSRRFLVTDIRAEEHILLGFAEDSDRKMRILYNVPGKNDLFTPAIQLMQRYLKLPVQLSLYGIHQQDEQTWIPEAIVMEPDFLIDVTAIASCFRGSEITIHGYLLKKYLPYHMSQPLLLGNIANYFLDELIRNPDVRFAELLPGIFRLYPLELALLSDAEVKELIGKSDLHFRHLKRVVEIDFPRIQVYPESCIIEPSFFAAEFGIQGRLDLLYRDPLDEQRRVIIELKSGKVFNASIHGINQDHLVQTLLYDLLIQAAYGKDQQAENYILYSALPQRQLLRAPRSEAQQYDALQVRNRLIALEFALANLGLDSGTDLLSQGNSFFNKWSTVHLTQLRGFDRDAVFAFEKAYQCMPDLVKKYFIAFSGFIAREQVLARKGLEGLDQARGQAALWLNYPEDKEAAFMIFQFLRWLPEEETEDSQTLVFERTERTGKLANFRPGDIALLYPSDESGNKIVASQVFKCTLVSIQVSRVVVRLRYPQADLRRYDFWNLEPDMLDSGFLSLSRGLFEFALAGEPFQRLLLGKQAPAVGTAVAKNMIPTELPERQSAILEKALQTKDYFLLWGPPGTGKTSVFLRQLTAILMEKTSENILLMAYTNRAVDEICESVESAGLTDYLRIGSEHSCDSRYREKLFSRQLEGISNRQSLLQLLEQKRLFVGTLASMLNNMDLFRIKKFHSAIIDEASQILEPMLAGILSRFDRFFLIGDHHQLPAVVMQSEAESVVFDEDLQGLGLFNLRNSLFERLFAIARKENRTHAYAMLQHQGRMHRELMDFPAGMFYENNLDILPSDLVHSQRQSRSYWIAPDDLEEAFRQHPVFCRRLIFIPTRAEIHAGGLKANESEAEQVSRILKLYLQALPIGRKLSVGIITPYRAQIALIRQKLEEQGLDPDDFTIDTVERYQGGARDVIILSLCTNSLFQFRQVAQISEEGVDRKLNVALTRAREQIIMLGDPEILSRMPFYADWIAAAFLLENTQGI